MRISLNENWKMTKAGSSESFDCKVPCSVYKTLLDYKKIPDPYYRENEYISTQICDDDYDFETTFTADNTAADCQFTVLHFDGIDTIAEVYLNGKHLGRVNNMHRMWEFPVHGILKAGENTLTVKIKSPNQYIKEMDEKRHLWGVDSTMTGYTHIRKAHCMFGWDWGPMLPDMGIWRDVTLVIPEKGRILDVYYSQLHVDGNVTLKAVLHIENHGCQKASVTVFDPQGKAVAESVISLDDKSEYYETALDIADPQLWWVNGYGKQPLYNVTVKLLDNDVAADENSQRIGLRTLTVSQEKDGWGEEFCFINNGVKIFAMGANYIPEDQIVTRCNEEKTRKLLADCKAANYNFIRVWGGGYYPDQYFYDYCDENGIIIWQDFMFACSAYLLTEEFEETVRGEIRDNVIRLRNHPSLGLWCGNNEIESAWEYWGLPEDEEAKSDYLIIFEEIIPQVLKEFDPCENTFYWPSSPSSGGGFKDASSNHAGDMHYWDVWHNFKPIEAFREFYYRFCSEYGFESVPDINTCREFADEAKGDFDLCSPVMEAHQKCVQGNEKIMYYLAQMVRYPYDFRQLIYSSQLVQADCIRSNVEHMRRARGRCMGSAYWQVNDSNPVISWSSIDYFGRWKGLHYYARKFYAPCLISCDDSDINKPVLNISNERRKPFDGIVKWTLRNNKAEIITSGEKQVSVAALTAENVLTIDLADELESRTDRREKYLEYSIIENGVTLSGGTTLFVRPKEFTFLEPNITFGVSESEDSFAVTLCAENYAKSVCLSLKNADCVFSDNWFDIHGKEPVTVEVKKANLSKPLTAEEFSAELEIMHN
ncbi:glycoside hydrolase family 2 protein [Ruminococcus sp.]|uniref:beta-mannosidase n=1 Tax=Ruminococcus sp. TaxID=41978 RepID=UPI0025DA6BD7|nr:glycoside hydrolase family 2 protein [Ruminococcus sp.]